MGDEGVVRDGGTRLVPSKEVVSGGVEIRHSFHEGVEVIVPQRRW